MFAPKPPRYEYHVRMVGETKVLCIVDLYDENDPTLTVTNGAELVLAEIARDLGELPEIIIYRDTDGVWDRMKAKSSGEFIGFMPIVKGLQNRPTEENQAIQLAVTVLGSKAQSVQ